MKKLFNNYQKTIKKLWENYWKTIEKLWENYSISMKKILPTIYRKWNQNETNFLQTILLKPERKNSEGLNIFDWCKKLTLVRFAFGFVGKWSGNTLEMNLHCLLVRFTFDFVEKCQWRLQKLFFSFWKLFF